MSAKSQALIEVEMRELTCDPDVVPDGRRVGGLEGSADGSAD
jgi:hypothetical protein